jgi:GNAT superfamily N-acetyltransferase
MTPATANGMEVLARVGTELDMPVLVELYQNFREALRGERGAAIYLSKEAFGEPLDSYFATIVHDRQHLVLLGLVDEVPVGLAVARLDELPDSSCTATALVIYVEPPAREVGVGENLLAAVVEWAGERGAGGLDVPVLPGMRESKNFLEGAGLVARLLVMHRRLN